MKDIMDYVVYKPQFLDPHICEEVAKEIMTEQFDWHTHTFYVPHTGTSYSRDAEELEVSSQGTKYTGFIMQELYKALKEYVSLKGGYWDSWEGYTGIRFNKYSEGTSMSGHIDHIQSIFPGDPKGIPILTMLCCVSESEEGGELILAGKAFSMKSGDLVLFPSNFLYPHSVTKVTKGTRVSFVSWAY